jgi:cytochrome d ubiquinol oxidase subunit I
MLENLDSTLLARIQFAFTISFHILFPAFTVAGIGAFYLWRQRPNRSHCC